MMLPRRRLHGSGAVRGLKDTLAYIREHYAQKLTLDEIAAHLHLSTNECCRFFKEKYELYPVRIHHGISPR